MKLHIVPARAGARWFKLGIVTFFRQPLALCGLFFAFMAAMSLLSMVPLLGNLLALTLLPGITLGLMVATEQASKGKFPMPTVLLSAFRAGRQQLRAMLGLGLLYALALLLVLGLSATLDGGKFARFYLQSGSLDVETAQSAAFQRAALLAVALYVPVSLLFWHAPALVYWHGVAPVKSLFFSLVACLRNFWAFTVYGLVWFGAFLAVGVVLAIVVSLLGNPEFMGLLMFPLALLMAAMFFTSIYFSFRDCFQAEA